MGSALKIQKKIFDAFFDNEEKGRGYWIGRLNIYC
jgi:hypothetical protein